MARCTDIDTNLRFLPVDPARQLLSGTFEHALQHLLEHAIDRSHFNARFRNDATAAPASPPALLLKVVHFAYSHGIVSSRAIARVFAAVLEIYDQQGLIGREMRAIDGVKLPSNASTGRSGTLADFARQATKLHAAATTMLQRRREADARPVEPELAAKDAQRIARLEKDAAEIREWLTTYPSDRLASKGAIRHSNRTDNESAKMATGKGVIQGYTGVAAVDRKAQIIAANQPRHLDAPNPLHDQSTPEAEAT